MLLTALLSTAAVLIIGCSSKEVEPKVIYVPQKCKTVDIEPAMILNEHWTYSIDMTDEQKKDIALKYFGQAYSNYLARTKESNYLRAALDACK